MPDTNLYGKQSGIVRTDLYCHDCNRQFLAKIDYDIDGTHEIECPSCGHKHYRRINNGRVTEERYDSDSTSIETRAKTERFMWKSNTIPLETSTVSHFLRDRWLNRSDNE
jgi:DNA-directed RNA polymerase subunit RPC12/RpoP